MSEQSNQLKQVSEKIDFLAIQIQEMSKQLLQLAELQEEPKEKTFGIEWFIDELRSYTENNFYPSLGDADDFVEFEGHHEYGGYKVTATFDECAIEDAINNKVTDLHNDFIDHIKELAEEQSHEN